MDTDIEEESINYVSLVMVVRQNNYRDRSHAIGDILIIQGSILASVVLRIDVIVFSTL